MQFEPATTTMAICTIIAVLGLQLLFFWVRDRRSPWLAWYAAAFIAGSLAVLLYLLPSKGHEFLMLGIGNAARILAFAFLWHGAREFVGRPPETHVVVLVIAVWLALCSMPEFLASMELRVIGASLATLLFCSLGALEFWRNRAEPLPSQAPLMLTYASFGFFCGGRVLLVQVAPFPVGALPVQGAWLAAFALIVFAHATFLAFLVLTITRERREVEHRQLALSDRLTGLLNRRAFLDEAERIRRRSGEADEAVAVLALDLDAFKSVNDRHGHAGGDQVLRHFASVARRTVRARDLLFRLGGDEFCCVLPGAGAADALRVAERIRTEFAREPASLNGRPVPSTLSIGIAAGTAGTDLEKLLESADTALYVAKARGRNCSVMADAPEAVIPADAIHAAA
jgi:diguanylate cyclase (GGDEF)-like protein